MSSGHSVKLETTGSFTVKRMPELGTVRFNISAESEDSSEVLHKVKTACDELSSQLKKLAAHKSEVSSATIESEEHDIDDQKLDPAFPIANWSLNEIRTSHYTRFPDNGPSHPAMRRVTEEKPTEIYCANASAKATFHDFSALSKMITAVTANPVISIDSVNWDVTRATRTALKSRVRTGAYADALATARDYAASISPNAEPRPVRVEARNDGMEGMSARPRTMAFASPAMAKSADEAPSFEPEAISISTRVSVEFELAL